MVETKTVDRVFAVGILLFGVYIVRNALVYGYMRGTTPGPGFFPFWVGLALIALSAVNLMRSLRGLERLDADFDVVGLYKTLGIIAIIAAFIVLAPVLGMLAGSSLLVLGTAFVIRPRWNARFAFRIVTIAIVFPIVCHFLFGVYLRVPLVDGVFGL